MLRNGHLTLNAGCRMQRTLNGIKVHMQFMFLCPLCVTSLLLGSHGLFPVTNFRFVKVLDQDIYFKIPEYHYIQLHPG